MSRRQKKKLGREASEKGGTDREGGALEVKKDNDFRKREGSVVLMWPSKMATEN